MLTRWKALLVATVVGLVVCSQSRADFIISSPGLNYQVGISNEGNLYDAVTGTGFRRVSDGYDPIFPGTPREAYGVSAGVVSGYADGQSFGLANIVVGSVVSGLNSALITTFLNNGSGNLLQIDQAYTFAAENVLVIATTITNVSGSSQDVTFRRSVDMDPNIISFDEFINVDSRIPFPEITSTAYYGFESPDPLDAYNPSFTAPATGGTFGPDDLGGSYTLNLGTLASGASTSFNVYYGISGVGQTEASLRSQVAGLGATFQISGRGEDNGESITLGYSSFSPIASAAPAPPTLVAGLVGVAGLGLVRRLRRKVAG